MPALEKQAAGAKKHPNVTTTLLSRAAFMVS
jgi:hypothetical protein